MDIILVRGNSAGLDDNNKLNDSICKAIERVDNVRLAEYRGQGVETANHIGYTWWVSKASTFELRMVCI